MVKTRTALAGLCLALAMLTASACAQINEAMNSRDDLQCTEVPEDICVMLAEDIAGHWLPSMAGQPGPVVKVTVKPVDCGELGLTIAPGARCWEGEAKVAGDGSGLGPVHYTYYQNADGRMFDDGGTVVGN